MKNWMASLALIIFSGPVLAGPIDGPAKAQKVKKGLKPIVFAMEGVNGIGITGCDPVSGERSDFRGDFVYCVEIMTKTEEARDHLEGLYPVGTKIKGVFIVVLKVGRILPD